jgi:hypothetical protein
MPHINSGLAIEDKIGNVRVVISVVDQIGVTAGIAILVNELNCPMVAIKAGISQSSFIVIVVSNTR